MSPNFKLAKYYNVTYKQSISTIKYGRRATEFVELTLKNVMFYKFTPCFYVFYASSQFIKIKRDNLVSFEEV